MPRSARYLLFWAPDRARYELHEDHVCVASSLCEGEGWWSAWLEQHHSLAFQGKQGHINLLKEARQRGSDYWYAYRTQQKRTSKKYAGRSRDLTLARLEELAAAFNAPHQEEQACALVPLPTSANTFAQTASSRISDPLLEPKFRAPRLPGELVPRERLLTHLNRGLNCKLTLLCAPAGFGKTVLTGQWLSEQSRSSSLPVAWISLDSGDNDPIRFWRYLITASQRFQAGIGQISLQQLTTGLSLSLEIPSLEQILTPLLNELNHAGCAGFLVLEDYHVVTEERIHKTLLFFLQHLPDTLHVIMLTRSEPPFPLALWRTRGDLCEVQAAALRFSQAESEAFFHKILSPEASQILSPDLTQRFHARVEGWATGLRLLALSLQRESPLQDVDRLIRHFAGDQRSIQEYFVAEVLNVQTEEMQQFLLKSSLLERLTGELCDALMERKDSMRFLERIEQKGLFLEALDEAGKWYRYHALFSEAMRAEARRRLGSDSLSGLYLRASLWYAQKHMLPDAIEVALLAGEYTRAASLIEQLISSSDHFMLHISLVRRPFEFHTLQRWLEQLPQTNLETRPLLCFGYAVSLVFVTFIEQRTPLNDLVVRIERSLQLAEDGWTREGDTARLGQIYTFRAMILRQPGFMNEAANYARQALELLPADAAYGRAMCLWLLGMQAFEDGNMLQAREIFLQVRAFYQAQQPSGILRANTVWLGLVDYVQGEWQAAAESFRSLLEEARAVEDKDDICDALLGLAQLAYEANDLARSEEQALEALKLAQDMAQYELLVQATLLLARIDLVHGRPTSAQQRCLSLLAALPRHWPQHLRLVREVRTMQARVAMIQGEAASVEQWWLSRDPLLEMPRTQQEREVLLWIRYLLWQNRELEALPRLDDLLLDAQHGGRNSSVWEIRLLKTLTYASLQQLSSARQEWNAFFEQAHLAGNVRLFLDARSQLASFLPTLLPTIHGEAQRLFVRHLLLALSEQAHLSSPHPSSFLSLPDQLSTQEQRVLQLLATGNSNPAIARQLVVSVNTVKAQVQSIYRKLNVNNRVEASEVARQLKLV